MKHLKENALEEFKEMIEKSWTYNKMTTKEKENWNKALEDIRVQKALKGSWQQRWNILQVAYESFLKALDYQNGLWRQDYVVADTKEDKITII